MWAQSDGITSALIRCIDGDGLDMEFDDAWSQVSVAVPLVRAGSGAAAEVADYSGMIARASVLTTSTRHISELHRRASSDPAQLSAVRAVRRGPAWSGVVRRKARPGI